MDKIKVYHDVLWAKKQPFADERDKKKLLELVAEQKKERKLDIFAFCVTDEECHFLVSGDSESDLSQAAVSVIDQFSTYYETCHNGENMCLVRENRSQKLMDLEELIEDCCRTHKIATEQKLAEKPEDYWWSSLGEYRRSYPIWESVVNPRFVLDYLDGNRTRALGKFLKLHRSTK